jgi:hypothetical protein
MNDTTEACTINGILAKLTIGERAILWAYIDEAKKDARRIALYEVRNTINNTFNL